MNQLPDWKLASLKSRSGREGAAHSSHSTCSCPWPAGCQALSSTPGCRDNWRAHPARAQMLRLTLAERVAEVGAAAGA